MVYLGQFLFVEVENAPGAPRLLFGIVRQSRYCEGEGYAIGVEFRSIPRTSAIRNWLMQRGENE